MKVKGSNAERHLVSMFWEHGFASLRIAGSGSMRFPSCDVLAANGSNIIAIECKATKKDRQYITEDQINDLIKFSRMFTAVPIVAVKFSSEWRFYHPDELRRTANGSIVINKKDNFKNFIDVVGAFV